MTDWTQYAVLVTATDSTSHGSGFVVEQGPTRAWIVTCDHVVADLRGDLRVNGRAATVVFRGGDAGVDLAVLEVEAPLGVATVR